MTTDWAPDGPELAVAFVRARTGVDAEVPLRSPTRRRGRGSDLQEWSGPRPGTRDPVPAGAVLDGIVDASGWSEPLAVHAVTGRWHEIVGPTVAEHTTVETFDDGVLVVRCSSTAWATQLRMLVPMILARLSDEAGPGIVTSVEVKGPAAPSWVRGPRRVKGRGPRDTYG